MINCNNDGVLWYSVGAACCVLHAACCVLRVASVLGAAYCVYIIGIGMMRL